VSASRIEFFFNDAITWVGDGIMFRIFLASSDVAFCDGLRDEFQREAEFQVCGQTQDVVDAVEMILHLDPDLVVLNEPSPPKSALNVAKLKSAAPGVTVFLVLESSDVAIERRALATGVDAVFEKNEEYSVLLLNARAICGLD
jgi:DNA-binding NarL/FixJ family response regulator